jgi:lantibiotic modifying enzyme
LGPFDLTAGLAGAIAGRVLLASLLQRTDLLGPAAQLADLLIAAGNGDQHSLSWSTPGSHLARDLCGFAHGAAGIGYALLELFSATGESRYRTGAERAFGYERSQFDQRRGAWPDFRVRQRRSMPQRLATHGYWCNGAPGIALARLRAWELLGGEVLRGEALTALALTRDAVNMTVAAESEDFSLCHGLAGNADVLLYGASVLKSDGDHASMLAGAVRQGLFGRPDAGRTWPSGLVAGDAPGLFLGLSGLAWFYLRVYEAHVPSPLVLHRT